MLKIVTDEKTLALTALAQPEFAPFKASPVLRPDSAKPRAERTSKTHYTAVASHLYILREAGADGYGAVPDGYLAKADDLIASGRRHPIQNVPPALRAGRQMWDEADAATTLDSGNAAAIHVILTLPNCPRHEWEPLVTRFIDDSLVSLGMIADYALHAKMGEDGKWSTRPHAHMLITARRWKNDQRKGQRMRCWLYTQAQIEALEVAWLKASGLPPKTFTLD